MGKADAGQADNDVGWMTEARKKPLCLGAYFAWGCFVETLDPCMARSRRQDVFEIENQAVGREQRLDAGLAQLGDAGRTGASSPALLASDDDEVQERAGGRHEPIFDTIGCEGTPRVDLPLSSMNAG
jgi:hypothetical protein